MTFSHAMHLDAIELHTPFLLLLILRILYRVDSEHNRDGIVVVRMHYSYNSSCCSLDALLNKLHQYILYYKIVKEVHHLIINHLLEERL